MVPWGDCGNDWNTPLCVDPYERKKLLQDFTPYNVSIDNKLVEKNWTRYYINETWYNSTELKDPVKEYWELVYHPSWSFTLQQAPSSGGQSN